MKYLIKLSILSSLILSTGAEAKEVIDPMRYSEVISKNFAEGDSNDSSGWEECVYDDAEAGALTVIFCRGTRSVLIHGGEMQIVRFLCGFNFEPSWVNYTKYSVSFEQCE